MEMHFLILPAKAKKVSKGKCNKLSNNQNVNLNLEVSTRAYLASYQQRISLRLYCINYVNKRN